MGPDIVENRNSDMEAKSFKEPKSEMLKRHHINIRFLDVGCVIEIGCKSIAFTTPEEAMAELNDYVKDPHTVSKKWHAIFNKEQ